MKFLDHTEATPARNLALDEALLDACEEGACDEVLRFWAPEQYFVVVGYANKIDVEVDRQECLRRQIPIYRRCSGGGTVVQGVGCLNYTLVLKITDELQGIPQTNTFVMERNRQALEQLIGKPVRVRGHTDLAVGDIKFSGNAQRRKKNHLLFHGTFLLNFDLELIQNILRFPSKQPDYRQDRPHRQFLTNIYMAPETVKRALQTAWEAEAPLQTPPDFTDLAQKYASNDWNQKF